MMNNKIIILLGCIFVFVLLTSPSFAKENVDVKVSADTGYIVIKLVDSHGKAIKSKGTIHYTITDSNGHYDWAYKPYKQLRLKYDPGWYSVDVKFDGDSKYDGVEKTDYVTVPSGSSFDPYTYYDNHNWGLDQKTDDYIEYNYWDEEIYDDASTYDGEGY